MKPLVIFIFLFWSKIIWGQPNHSLWQSKIDDVIHAIEIEKGPGGVIGVYSGNRKLYERAFGYADVDRKVVNTVDTKFDIASSSKQFTAASIMLLAKQEKIDLNKPVQYYFPELQITEPIPVHSLLSHSSGLHDISELLLLARGRQGADSYNSDVIKNIIMKQQELSFKPLTMSNYSNSNYFLLAELVEYASGIKYDIFLKKHLFEPLNMDLDGLSFIGRDDSGFAIGYPMRKQKRGPFIPEPSKQLKKNYGAGGIRANLSFLSQWMSTYKSGQLGKENMMDMLLVKDELIDGGKSRYARGLDFGTTRSGIRWVQQTGRSNSTSILLWLPDYDVSVIALFNTQEIWAQSVTNLFLKDIVSALKQYSESSSQKSAVLDPKDNIAENTPVSDSNPYIESSAPSNKVSLSLEELRKFTGIYPADAPVGNSQPPSGGVGVDRIELVHGKLKYILYNGMEFELQPVNNNVLELKGLGRPIKLHFEHFGTSTKSYFVSDPMVNNGKLSESITRVPPLPAPLSTDICGRYKAESLINAIPVEIICNENGISFQWGEQHSQVELSYLGNNRFTCWRDGVNGMQANIIAKLDSAGAVRGFVYEGHRVWGLTFTKI